MISSQGYQKRASDPADAVKAVPCRRPTGRRFNLFKLGLRDRVERGSSRGCFSAGRRSLSARGWHFQRTLFVC